MARPTLPLNALLLVLSAGFALVIVRELTTPAPVAPVRRPVAPTPSPPPAAVAPPSGAVPAASIASHNLFSPTRTEELATAAVGPAVNVPKPSLHGVVLRDNGPVAFLEDPSTKRVAGYRVGDHVAGGTVQTIGADKIVLLRPEGPVDIRLHDPARPRPPAPAAPGQPGAPGAAAPTPYPGAPVPTPPSVTPPSPTQPQTAQPAEGPGAPDSGRSLPPNLVRRPPRGVTPLTPDAAR
jgi:Type II secretion system protein C